MDETDKLARAYSRLLGIRKNIPDSQFYVDEDVVEQYHQSLHHLADLDFAVAEFRIPDRWLEYRAVSWGGGQAPKYRKKKEVESTKFLLKLDAVLEYFDPAANPAPEEKRVIGFRGPRKDSEV